MNFLSGYKNLSHSILSITLLSHLIIQLKKINDFKTKIKSLENKERKLLID